MRLAPRLLLGHCPATRTRPRLGRRALGAATEALERLNNEAVGPLNAIKLQGSETGTVDNPYDPTELPAVSKAEAACRAAMKLRC